jgi:hypothetical protein
MISVLYSHHSFPIIELDLLLMIKIDSAYVCVRIEDENTQKTFKSASYMIYMYISRK